jgi:hypothetical protein
MTMSNRALIMLSDALRERRTQRGTRWRRLPAGEQALLVIAHLRKGETCTDLALGFGIGTTTVFATSKRRSTSLPTGHRHSSRRSSWPSARRS